MKVIVIGSINLDTVVNVDHFPAPGETVSGEHSKVMLGGKGLNQAVAAARMGANVVMVSAVGQDIVSTRPWKDLQEESELDLSQVEVLESLPTGQAIVTVDEAGENTIIILEGANGAHTPEGVVEQLEVAERGDILLCQLEVRSNVVKAALEEAQKRGVYTILNAAPAAVIDDLLPFVDLLVVNETEAQILLQHGDDLAEALDECAYNLAQRFSVDAVVTGGAQGVWWAAHGSHHESSGTTHEIHSGHVSPYSVEAVDTTGAGDAFVGALASAIADGKTLTKALEVAAVLGALACTSLGAQGYAARKEDVLKICDRDGSQSENSGLLNV